MLDPYHVMSWLGAIVVCAPVLLMLFLGLSFLVYGRLA